MKQWQIILASGVIALVSAISGYQLQQYLKNDERELSKPIQKQHSAEALIGTPVEEFRLFDVNGQQRQLSEWQDNIIILNFWATWCPPCRKEIPHFVTLQKQYANNRVQFIGIALQSADEVRDFLAEFNVNYPTLVGMDDVIKLAGKLGNDIGALPYTVIIDRTGRIAFRQRGPLAKSKAKSVIESLLIK